MKTKFYREATGELEDALEWYRSNSAIAEAKFANAVERALASIDQTPGRYLKLSLTHRACRVIGFPYRVIYRIEGEFLIIVAVAHTSRRPGHWKRRQT